MAANKIDWIRPADAIETLMSKTSKDVPKQRGKNIAIQDVHDIHKDIVHVHVILHDDALVLYFFKKSKFAM